MKVYLLWHDTHDYDSGPWLRGTYAHREDAERDLPVEGVEISATRYNGLDGPACQTRDHAWCCSVEEIEILEAPVGPTAMLPERPPSGDMKDSFILSAKLADSIQDLATREMIWSRIARHEGPIGQVIERKESEDGLQVTVRLDE